MISEGRRAEGLTCSGPCNMFEGKTQNPGFGFWFFLHGLIASVKTKRF